MEDLIAKKVNKESSTNLQELDLSNNSLTEIKGLDALVNLQKLDLSNNSITEIKGLDALTNLQVLWLYNNSIIEIKGLNTLTNLQELWLSYNSLTEIKGLDTLTNLQELYLSYNSLTEIRGLDTLTNLQKLSLSHNSITEIKGLDTLTNLQELDLFNNSLTEIKGLDALTNLQELWLSNNSLTEIKGINTLTNLQELWLYNNSLTEIKGLDTLTNLQKLDLSNNSLTEIKGLDALTILQNLRLYNNSLTEIPIELLCLRRLTTFYYNDNPIEFIPPIVQRFIDRINRRNFDTDTIYNDTQNVHDSTIQKSIQTSIFKLLKRPLGNTTIDSVFNQVMDDSVLTEKTKCLIGEYCTESAVHSILQITFTDLFIAVWNTIQNNKHSQEIKRILNTELQDAECQCFTGRLSRLINCLNGFDSDIQIQIADKAQISNIVILVKERLESEENYNIENHRLQTQKELTERGYDQETIQEFIEYIE